MGADALGGAGQTEIVGETGSDDHSHYKYGGIAIALTGEKQLPAGAAAGQGEGQTGQGHPGKIPDVHGVGHGLTGKARMELTQCQVGEKSGTPRG
jgi:hypothetical protein